MSVSLCLGVGGGGEQVERGVLGRGERLGGAGGGARFVLFCLFVSLKALVRGFHALHEYTEISWLIPDVQYWCLFNTTLSSGSTESEGVLVSL